MVAYIALQELSTRLVREEGGVDRPTLEPILNSGWCCCSLHSRKKVGTWFPPLFFSKICQNTFEKKTQKSELVCKNSWFCLKLGFTKFRKLIRKNIVENIGSQKKDHLFQLCSLPRRGLCRHRTTFHCWAASYFIKKKNPQITYQTIWGPLIREHFISRPLKITTNSNKRKTSIWRT